MIVVLDCSIVTFDERDFYRGFDSLDFRRRMQVVEVFSCMAFLGRLFPGNVRRIMNERGQMLHQ